MSDKLLGVKEWGKTICVYISAASGILSLLMVAWYSGGIVEKIHGIDRRVTVMEDGGSKLATKHVSEDDARDAATADRTTKLEVAIGVIPMINERLATLIAEQRAMQSQFNDLKDRLR